MQSFTNQIFLVLFPIHEHWSEASFEWQLLSILSLEQNYRNFAKTFFKCILLDLDLNEMCSQEYLWQ